MMRERIEAAIKEVVGHDLHFVVERPRALAHGDYSTNAALVAKVDPQALAEKLSIEGVARVEVVGKFINFFLSREALVPVSAAIATPYEGQTVMVEYTDPNPFKEFHIGHLMSNAIGESIARLVEIAGGKVLRANYQGDVGPHVARAIWGKMQRPELAWGAAYAFGAGAYEDNKAEIDAINKKVYDRSDETINALYDQGRQESLDRFEEIYAMLGTRFDYYFFESVTAPKGLEIIRQNKHVFAESEGATVFHGAHTRVFVTSQGLPTYEVKDLGLAELKKETAPFDISISITANEQTEYFKVVMQALYTIHPEWQGQFLHRAHGMMRLPEGKMSSRTGNVVTGESLLADLTEASRGRCDVAVGAVKYIVLRSASGKDIIFDPQKSLSTEGDSGPYLQYALVRARALLRKAKDIGVEPQANYLPTEANMLERTLVHYADAVDRAVAELEPHYVTTYLTELAGAFNSWYAQEKILGGEHEAYGLFLAEAVERTLSEGLGLLGIPSPEEM